MLNKDQYNEEAYNDYYRQESQGIASDVEESSSIKKIIFILFSLLVFATGGYFGYKAFNDANNTKHINDEIAIETDDDLVVQYEAPQEEKNKTTTVEKNIKPLDKPLIQSPQTENTEISTVQNIQETLIKSAIGSNQQMSPEEIAQVVQMVMEKIEKQEDSKSELNNTEKKPSSNSELIAALSNIDTITEEESSLEDKLNAVEETKNSTIQENIKSVNSYNKVTIDQTAGNDELSQLSQQISSLISNTSDTKKADSSTAEQTYTQSIEKEVVIRKNEMRIIVVKKGDTLGKIAKRAYGKSMDYIKIYKANPDILNRPDRIYIGQKLRIPN